MRVLTVSAHYPPNFVSGGTLQPQRISRGLVGLGHDVTVFAGWLGDRPPLTTWQDTDETGLAVRWVVSTPWTGWEDEHNWQNPAITTLFRDHVEAERPDIVHFHSLQSLGAGLVPVARASGARVVVTMHDFWWLCARQFLVDTDMVPCSLVVGCGECACQSGTAERDHRRASLRTLLEGADLVLAPSDSAAAVLVANGVAPGRLEVDENGLPAATLTAAPAGEPGTMLREGADGSAPVRFVYTGGPNPMKGAAVLVAAVRRVARELGEGGWTLTAYGLAEHLRDTGEDIDARPVTLEPPFGPDELASVLSAHDVFLLPSVMRETYSIATREALDAGLPVITSDTLGPEEAVGHGRNGLIVPAGDPAALADAMTRLVRDRDQLARLQAGAAQPIAIRPIEEQVRGLADRFEQLLTADRPARSRGPVRSVVFVCGIDGAPLRYRAHLPAEALALEGIRSEVRHYRDPELLSACGGADVVVFYRVPATIQILELIDALHAAGIPCAFDVDDLIFDPEIQAEIPALRLLPPDEARLWLEGVNRYRTTLEACDAYIGSTAALVDHAARVTGLPAHRFANGVGRVLALRSDAEHRRPRRPGPVRMGYFSGTTTHDEDWFHIEAAVLEALARHPGAELWLGGHLPESEALHHLGPSLVRLPFVPWLELPGLLRDLDINLAPLAPGSRFNEAKSAIKWLEAALVATPTVSSPTGPFREAIIDGESGVLAAEPSDWTEALDQLLSDAGERTRLGTQAQRRALLEWSPERQGRRYAEILGQVAAAGVAPERPASAWVPVALDEPAMPTNVDAYGPTIVAPAPLASAESGSASGSGSEPSTADQAIVPTDREARLLALMRQVRAAQYRTKVSVDERGYVATARAIARKGRGRFS